MLEGEPDPAEHLDAGLGDLDRAVEARSPRRRRRRTPTARRRPTRAPATSHAAAVTASAVSSISAHRCLTAWKLPIGLPNCSRTLAYSTAVSQAPAGHAGRLRGGERHRRTTDQLARSGRAPASPSAGRPRPCRTGGSGRASGRGVTVAASAGTRNQRSSASPSSRWVAEGASQTTSSRSSARPTTAPSGSVAEQRAARPPARAAGRAPARGRRPRGRPPGRAPSASAAGDSGSRSSATPISPTRLPDLVEASPPASPSAVARPPRRPPSAGRPLAQAGGQLDVLVGDPDGHAG